MTKCVGGVTDVTWERLDKGPAVWYSRVCVCAVGVVSRANVCSVTSVTWFWVDMGAGVPYRGTQQRGDTPERKRERMEKWCDKCQQAPQRFRVWATRGQMDGGEITQELLGDICLDCFGELRQENEYRHGPRLTFMPLRKSPWVETGILFPRQ